MEGLCVQGKHQLTVNVKGEGVHTNVKSDDIVTKKNSLDNKPSEYSESPDNNVENKIRAEILKTNNTVGNDTVGNGEESKVKKVGYKDLSKLNQINLEMQKEWLKHSIIRTISIICKDGKERNITVIIINLKWKKPWCGGYKNVRSKKIYWNAYTQTVQSGSSQLVKWPIQEILTLSRDTQTYLDHVTRSVNTEQKKQTQTPLMFEEDYQHVIIPFKFSSREELEKKRNRVKNAILVIQKWVKRYIAMRDFRKRKELEEKFKELEEKRRKEEREIIAIPELLSMAVKPTIRTKSQLHSLEREVIKWKEQELEKIMLTKSGPLKYAALYELMDKEIQYLYQYESVRIKVKDDQMEKRKVTFLETISSGTNKKAKDLKELYELYINTNDKVERLDALVLLMNKIHSQYIDYEWAEDLKDLLSREYCLINAGYKDKDLINLQVRIEGLLFDLLLCPEYNPLANKYLSKSITTYHRKKIGRTKQRFSKPSYQKFSTESCWLENIGKVTKNLISYALLLKYLRNDEQELTSISWACWKLNPIDIYYLVDIIWNGRSMLSEKTDLNRLRLVRWYKYEEWTPWNCILLTEEEAIVQKEVSDVGEIYDDFLIRRIGIKHILAKMKFVKLYNLYIKTISPGDCRRENNIDKDEDSFRSPFDHLSSKE